MLKKNSMTYLLFESGKITWITKGKYGEVFVPWRMIEEGILKKPEAGFYIVKKTLEENNVPVNNIICVPLFGVEKYIEINIPNLEDKDIPGFIDFELKHKYPERNIGYEQGNVQDQKWKLYTLERKTYESYEIFNHLGKSCEILGLHEFLNQKGKNISNNYLFPSPDGVIYLEGNKIFKIKNSLDEFIVKNKYGTEDFYKYLENKFVKEDTSLEPLENSWKIYLLQNFSQLFKDREDKIIKIHDLVPKDILNIFTNGPILEGATWGDLPYEWEEHKKKWESFKVKKISFYKIISLVSLLSIFLCFLHFTFIYPQNMKKELDITKENIMFLAEDLKKKGISDVNVHWEKNNIKISGRATNEKSIEKYQKELSKHYGNVKLTSLTKDDTHYVFLIESR
ncbi:MAG: hypothetical protein Q4Q07_03365 [Tissierellia bacterium]|nr:hypothetical protein [Tissierellia bacterium]